MKYQIVLTLLSLSPNLTSVNAQYRNNLCVPLQEQCLQDCDCCGFNDDVNFPLDSFRCETRNKPLGKRCYKCRESHGSCESDDQCCSQHCVSGMCYPTSHPGKPLYCMESMIDQNLVRIEAVSGEVPEEEDLCPCTGLLESQTAINVGSIIDGNFGTSYTNNYPLGAGIIMESNFHTPIRELKVCPSLDCVECDPTCYKIEAKCEGENEWTFVQAGSLSLDVHDRNQCQLIEIKGRHQFTMLKVTFPCQRGGWPACDGEYSCRNYPLKVSEIDAHSKCREIDEEPPTPKGPEPQTSKPCATLGDTCVEDCECCGYKSPFAAESLRCEKRNEPLGKRCYKCVALGDTCTKNAECCSQKCVDDECVPSAGEGRPLWCLESLFSSYSRFEQVPGVATSEEGLCPCTNLVGSQISSGLGNMIDHNQQSDYSNNYAIGAGFFLESNYHAPLRQFKVCPNLDCVECDPTCYKIEGMCDYDTRFSLVQEGELDLSTEDRHTCVTIPVLGRHEYSKYRVTFPCQRGGFDSCEESGSCKNYPMKISEADLLAKCVDTEPEIM